ncbi:MAG: ribonuclease J [Rickettsiales bacterium]|nr:ribonuclease J [Rickettsiales bacterium]
MMSFNFEKYKDELLFVPLGGSNEIGMNLNLYTYGGKWLMVDCGIGFANDYLPGVEIILPDISFVHEIKDKLLGLVLTHAHEDHLGAVPYLWREFECPVYATPFTAAFLKHKLSEMGPGKKPVVHELKPGSSFDLAPFSLELVQLTHSIPEMQALAINTPKGVVMHTGDWKFDAAPMVGPVSDYETLKRYGDQKVLAMVCDSTNVFEPGESGSEGDVRKELISLIASCQQRVVVTTFASNLARVISLIMAAHEAGRVIALAGRSLWRVVEAAKESGYLDKDIEFLSDREIMNLPRKDAMIICTGCQGETRAALTRIARGDHPTLRLAPGDTVIFSSRKIPGNETRVNWIINRLVEKNIEVITAKEHFIHVSGHPARDELKHMYELVRPEIAIPTHGELRHLHEHARFAKSMGVPETVQAYNGAVVWLEKGEASVIGKVDAGYIAVDGNTMISTESEILRTRRKLRDDGCVVASVVVSHKGGLMHPVTITAPGVLDLKEDQELLDSWCDEASRIVDGMKGKRSKEEVKEAVRLFLRKAISRDLEKKPVLEVHVAKVD